VFIYHKQLNGILSFELHFLCHLNVSPCHLEDHVIACSCTNTHFVGNLYANKVIHNYDYSVKQKRKCFWGFPPIGTISVKARIVDEIIAKSVDFCSYLKYHKR